MRKRVVTPGILIVLYRYARIFASISVGVRVSNPRLFVAPDLRPWFPPQSVPCRACAGPGSESGSLLTPGWRKPDSNSLGPALDAHRKRLSNPPLA